MLDKKGLALYKSKYLLNLQNFLNIGFKKCHNVKKRGENKPVRALYG